MSDTNKEKEKIMKMYVDGIISEEDFTEKMNDKVKLDKELMNRILSNSIHPTIINAKDIIQFAKDKAISNNDKKENK